MSEPSTRPTRDELIALASDIFGCPPDGGVYATVEQLADAVLARINAAWAELEARNTRLRETLALHTGPHVTMTESYANELERARDERDALICECDAARAEQRETDAKIAESKFPRCGAHTYASENADYYIALEAACETIAAAIRAQGGTR